METKRESRFGDSVGGAKPLRESPWIGGLIRDLRRSTGKTQKELAALLGRNRAWMNRVEHGRGRIAFSELEDIFRRCDASAVVFLNTEKIVGLVNQEF
jgi:transcriptional regulator with XRE-family HTH domain